MELKSALSSANIILAMIDPSSNACMSRRVRNLEVQAFKVHAACPLDQNSEFLGVVT